MTEQREWTKVKPLEWRRFGWVEAFSQPDGLGLWYSIQPARPARGPGDPPFSCLVTWAVPGQQMREELGLDFQTLDAAQSSAQAHFDAAILSALIPAEPPVAEIKHTQPIARYHSIERTSAVGERFIGTCWQCGKTGLTLSDGQEPCENIAALTEGESLLIALETNFVAGKEWRCFHCDEIFSDERSAGLHFGMDQCRDPACKIKMGAEGSLVKALRRAEAELADAWAAIHNESTEAAKAYHSQQSRHQEQIRAAEELGYERGLSDGRATPPTADLQAEVERLLGDQADLIEAVQPLLGCADFAREQDLSPHETLIVTADEARHAATVVEGILARAALGDGQ